MKWWRLHLMHLGFTFDQVTALRNADAFELIRLDVTLNACTESAR